jgi:hypothetical protein
MASMVEEPTCPLLIPGKLYNIRPGWMVSFYKADSFGGRVCQSGIFTFHTRQGPIFYLGEVNTREWFQYYFLVGGSFYYLPVPTDLTREKIGLYWDARLLL